MTTRPDYGFETLLPSIPTPNDSNLVDVVHAIREQLQVRTGAVGDGMDRAVTLRDLLNSGVATPFDLRNLGRGGITPFPLGTGDNDPDIPPTPDHLEASGALKYIILTWNFARGYSRLAFFEVWRSLTDNLSEAILIGQTFAPIYADNVGPGKSYYYWVRAVSDAAASPFNSLSGTLGQTAIDPAYIIEILTGKITESQLWHELGDRINLIDGAAALAGSVNARVEAAKQIAAAAVAAARQEAADALAAALLAVDVDLTAALAALNAELDAAGSAIISLQTVDATHTSDITALGTRTGAAESTIVTLSATTAGQATQLTTLTSRADTAASNITTLNTTTATQATALTSLGTRVGTAESSITTLSSTTADHSTHLVALDTRADNAASSISTLNSTTSTQATAVTALTTRVGTAESNITTLNTTTSGQATALTTLGTRVDGAESSISTLNTTTASQASAATALTTRVGTAESNIATINTTTAGQATAITSLGTRTGTAESNISALQSTTSTQASSLSTLSSTVGGFSTAISSNTTSINGLNGSLTFKIDNNGYVSGYGLASDYTNGVATSSMIVRSDSFAIGSPSGPGITPALPFIVRTTVSTINGVSVPIGVYIADAFIANGVISNAKIGNLQVDDAKIANLSVAKLLAGKLGVGEYIESTNYLAGDTGFRIHGNGNAEFSNVTVRGTVYATAGKIGGINISGAALYTDNYTSTTGWGINADGSAYLNNAYIRGQLIAASGTLGVITAATIRSAASGARSEMTETGFRCYDGTLTLPRAEMGLLS